MRTGARGATTHHPFDCSGATCENRIVKLHIVCLLLSIAACGKANDVPAMRAEAEGLVKNYAARFDELDRRANEIMRRGNAIGVTSPDAANASRLFATAQGKLKDLEGIVTTAPNEIKNAKDKLEMQRLLDSYQGRLEEGFTEVNSEFNAVEDWISVAEQRPQQVSHNESSTPATPAVPPPPPSDPNAPPPATDANGNPVR